MRATRTLLALALVHPTAALPGAERRPLQEGWRITLDPGPALEVVVTTASRSDGRATSAVPEDLATGAP